jgi:hypothetical protein
MSDVIEWDDSAEAYMQYALSGNLATSGQGAIGVLPFAVDVGSFPNGLLVYNGNNTFSVTVPCSVRFTFHVEATMGAANAGWTAFLAKNGAAVPFSNAPGNARNLINESDMVRKIVIVDMLTTDSVSVGSFIKEPNPFFGTSTLTNYALAPGTVPAGTLYGSLLIIEVVRLTP